jgi:hypothetical protein
MSTYIINYIFQNQYQNIILAQLPQQITLSPLKSEAKYFVGMQHTLHPILSQINPVHALKPSHINITSSLFPSKLSRLIYSMNVSSPLCMLRVLPKHEDLCYANFSTVLTPLRFQVQIFSQHSKGTMFQA